jgi:formylmethanofuran dehydrogenase subunit B
MTTPWTCPFCPLACDHLGVRVGGEGEALALVGADCALAREALGRIPSRPQAASASVDGVPATTEAAVAVAARWLAASTQPLIAGLGTDVAGARALYPLACTLGAVCDAAGGDALMQGLRALQDRGQFTTTLAEVRTRADVIVFVGGLPVAMAPLIADRCGFGDPQVPARHVVIVGGGDDDAAHAAAWASRTGVTVESIALQGDLFDTLSLLQALVAGRALPPGVESAALAALAARLHAASYAVLVGAPPRLPAQGALLIEAVHQVVELLNRKSRAAALWIGGGNGAATANQVFAWLSGLPMRTRIGARGLEHDPLLNGAGTLLADGAVDAVLWVSSFVADALPPTAAQALPTVVLGPPAQAAACQRAGVVFIPVSTPGIGSGGHVFRTDGTVLMPLHAVRPDGLPGVADVAASLHAAVRAERERAAS